jgi:ABC-type transport system substrate-binding protein
MVWRFMIFSDEDVQAIKGGYWRMCRWQRVMFIGLVLILIGLLGTGLGSAQRIAREETLYIAGQQWGPPTSFNPIGRGAIAWPVGNNSLYVYETLYAFNLFTGELEPVLAEK